MATDTAAHLPPTDLTTLTWGGVELGWVGLRGCGGFSKPFWNISQHQPLFLFYFILFYVFSKTFSPQTFYSNQAYSSMISILFL
jgi:hypothetical protein